eukprot:1193424-Prorocentrum_minimum.AAC.2
MVRRRPRGPRAVRTSSSHGRTAPPDPRPPAHTSHRATQATIMSTWLQTTSRSKRHDMALNSMAPNDTSLQTTLRSACPQYDLGGSPGAK